MNTIENDTIEFHLNEAVLATSMRNFVVRISAINHIHQDNDELGLKEGDIKRYCFKDIIQILDDWAATKKLSYFAIEHNEDLNNIHYHIVVKCAFATQYNQIKGKFPFGHIEKCKYGVKSCVQYLIHLNDKDKAQYEWSDVVTNAPDQLEGYKISEGDKATMLIEMIANGDIREFEIADKISQKIYLKYAKRIKTALEYQRKLQISKSAKRNINVIVLMGPSRVGKTTYCRVWAEKHNKSYCLSGGSRDVWGDYMGEDIFIYDDSDFSKEKITDMLKVLDPHNNSSVSSRYHNKYFLGDTIFICTNTDVTQWFKYTEDKLREAFFKRISFVLKFLDISNDYVSSYTVNKIVYSDEEPIKLYDEQGYYTGCVKPRKLQCIDGETHYFDLKHHIDVTVNVNKQEELFNEIITM